MRIILILIVVIINLNVYSQASWKGNFYFNLTNSKGDTITHDDAINKRIRFYSFNSVREIVKYDFKNKSFVFSTNTTTENNSFYIVYCTDTLKIKCLILKQKGIYVIENIPIKKNIVSYSSSKIIDFVNKSNPSFKIKNEEIFYVNNSVSSSTKFDNIEQNHIKKHSRNFKLIDIH